MSDEKNLIRDIAEGLHDLREYIKHPNVRTSIVYEQSMEVLTKAGTLAAATAVSGMLAATGPVISTEQPVRKPDEHIASQSHASEAILEASNTIEEDLTSVVQARVSDTAQVRTKTRAQVVMDAPPQLLPLLGEVEPDKS